MLPDVLHVRARRPAPPLITAGLDLTDIEWLPMEPSPELTAEEVVQIVCLGLQHNDVPTPDAGIMRLYNFLTPQGRVAIAPPPPKSGLQGGVSLEFFLAEAASIALGSVLLCDGFNIVTETQTTPGAPL